MSRWVKLTKKEMMTKCDEFMTGLAEELKDQFEFDRSPFAPTSSYLIPNGTSDQNTYSSKPMNSFRCSDHWNWYANLKKCKDPNYVQCNNLDVPAERHRYKPDKASEPRSACQVAYFGSDYRFHCIYGEKFDRESGRWCWVEASPSMVAELFLKANA